MTKAPKNDQMNGYSNFTKKITEETTIGFLIEIAIFFSYILVPAANSD